MFLNSLKVTSIARKIDKHLRDRKFESFKKEPVAICILQCDAKAFKSEFISDLKKAITNNPSLEVDVISYVEELPKDDNGKQALFSDKDIGWNGVLKSDVLKDFSQKRYDILINYYDGERISLQLLSAASQAYFKVGISMNNQQLNDLIIQTGIGKEQDFIRELKKYLKIIK